MKTVKKQRHRAAAHPGQDRQLPGVVTHSRLQRATSVRSRVGIVFKTKTAVAIDWVTGRSYSSARRRLNVQSGQRKGRKGAAAPKRAVPRPVVRNGWKGVRPGVRLESRSGEPVRSPKNTSGRKSHSKIEADECGLAMQRKDS